LRSPDELDHPLKLGSAELGYNLVDTFLMEQQNSRDTERASSSDRVYLIIVEVRQLPRYSLLRQAGY
jgi:hypothetical protein